MNKYDVIVIGSGISGLTTSLIFAKEGMKVALFERDQDIAPLIRPYKRKGYEFSPGVHISGWMDEGEVIASFLEYLNVSDGVEKELLENGFVNVIIGSNKYHIPRGFDNVEKSLLSYFPESTEAVGKYMRLIRDVNEQSFYFNPKLTPEKTNHHEFVGSSNFTLKDFLDRYHASQELVDVLGAVNSILIGSKADEVPFSVHAFVFGGFYRSPGFFTVKGINRLLANFKRELTRLGVDLFLNSEVAEIMVGNDKNVIGVKTLNGGLYSTSNVIASFNPKLLSEKVKQNLLRPVYRQRLDEAENTNGLYVTFYKIEDEDFKIKNFVYYDKNSDITLGATINHSGNHRIICVFLEGNEKIIPTCNEERKKLAEEKFVLLEDTFFNQIPDLKGKMILLDYLKPWSFERYTKTKNGSAYGIKQTIKSIGFQHKVPIRGLYLVGQAIYPGFLGSMISGFSLGCELFEADKFWSRVVTNEIK